MCHPEGIGGSAYASRRLEICLNLSLPPCIAGADPAGGLRGSEPLPNDKGRSCAEGAEAPISIFFANNNQRAALRANRAQSLVGG